MNLIDELDKANAALALYFKTKHLIKHGKLPPPDNSDIPSEKDISNEKRVRKTRTPYSPSSTTTRRRRIITELESVDSSEESDCEQQVLAPPPSKKQLSITKSTSSTRQAFQKVPVPVPPRDLSIMPLLVLERSDSHQSSKGT